MPDRGAAPARMWVKIAVLLIAVAALGACQRKTNIVVIPPDSTGTAVTDSSTLELRQAQKLWDAGSSQDAAAMTAAALAHDLAGHAAVDWRDRAAFLLDSLGIGAETATAPCALLVNFFPRSDPESGSWPYVFWCTENGTAQHAIDGKGLHLLSIAARGIREAGPPDSVRVLSAVFSRRAAGGLQPIVYSWTLPRRGSPHWSLIQSLGPDSLGGFGSAEFETGSDSLVLAARTYRAPVGFVECTTCPHIYSRSRFRWTSSGFARAEVQRLPSPYATFTDFVRALVAGDRDAAATHTVDAGLVAEAERLDWNVPRGAWRPAPGSDESPLQMTFFRGQKEAYAVHFRQQGQDWMIVSFEPVARSVE